MITLQHAIVTLLGMRGDERELSEEIQYVLLPDAIRMYAGPRKYSHFEKSSDGKDVSWMRYPRELKSISKDTVEKADKHIVTDIKPCVLGEETDIKTFEQQNKYLPFRYFYGVKKHLTQDHIFDEFIREKIDCSRMYEDKFYFNGQEYNGAGIRKVIADIEAHGVYVLAYMLNKTYGITPNQKWFDKHVKPVLDREYPEELAENTYKYMKIPEVIDERITAQDWGHLEMGPISLREYITMYEKVVKEMPKIDYERKVEEDSILIGLPESSIKAILGLPTFPEDHDD